MSFPSLHVFERKEDSFGQWFAPIEIKDVAVGSYLVLAGSPTKITSHKISKVGKHGHTKSHLVGVCVHTGTKREWVGPSHDIGYTPTVKRLPYVCHGFDLNHDTDTGYFILWNDTTMTQRHDMPFRPRTVPLHKRIQSEIENGSEDHEVLVTVLIAPMLDNAAKEVFRIAEHIESFTRLEIS